MLVPILGHVAAGSGRGGFGRFDPAAVGHVAGRIRRATAERRYQSRLDEAVAAGLMVSVDVPSMLRYRVLSPDGVALDGIVAAVALDHPDAPILGHEETVPWEAGKRRRERSRSAAETRPIVVFDQPGFDLPPFPARSAVADTPSGYRHEVTLVAPIAIEPRPLIIADGHHRHAVAVDHARSMHRERGPGPWDAVLALVVPAGVGLRCGAFHRRFDRVEQAPERLDSDFEIIPIDRPATPPAGSIVLWPGVDRGRPMLLRLRPELATTLPGGHEVSGAAVARRFLYPHLGVAEHEAAYESRVRDVIADLPPEGAAVLLGPVPIEAVAAAALGGVALPPKATRIVPKPFRGVVIRRVD